MRYKMIKFDKIVEISHLIEDPNERKVFLEIYNKGLFKVIEEQTDLIKEYTERDLSVFAERCLEFASELIALHKDINDYKNEL
jgi:hypothetical protein